MTVIREILETTAREPNKIRSKGDLIGLLKLKKPITSSRNNYIKYLRRTLEIIESEAQDKRNSNLATAAKRELNRLDYEHKWDQFLAEKNKSLRGIK